MRRERKGIILVELHLSRRQSQHQCQNPVLGLLFFPWSLVYPQFKPDIERDEIRKALLVSKKLIDWLNDFAPFHSWHFEVILIGGVL